MRRKGSLAVVFGVAAILAVFSVSSSFADNSYVARMEIITFQSTTLTDQEILRLKVLRLQHWMKKIAAAHC